ncbi:MAG: DUF5686 family protein [Bacteroidota bacterium]
MLLRRALPLLALFFTAQAQAQTVATGRVTDAETGEPLAAATVQVEGTAVGTITNRDGAYELRLPATPAVLVVRFIGYETARRTSEGGAADIALAPVGVVAGEVVVTGENPALNIMRRVIERKQAWQADLESWQADAYVRQTFGRDTLIVGIVEGVTEAYWRRGDGVRESVKDVRQTDNLQDFRPEFLRAADAILNFYDDEIEFVGFSLLGPTAPEALGFYRFTLDGTRYRDDEIVYDIGVTPKNRLQPGFEGRVSVLGGTYALIDVALRPNRSVRLPLVNALDLTFAQQFSSFGQEINERTAWLPADFRLDGAGRIGMTGLQFPAMTFRIVARLTDYEVNVAIPDSLFEREDGSTRPAVDSVALAAGTALDRAGVVVPLDPREAVAYAEIDSTDTIEEAYRPTGFLARFIDMDDGRSAGSGRSDRFLSTEAGLDLWYNRVEAAHLGAHAGVRPGRGPWLRGALGYATGLERLTYEASLAQTLRLPKRNRLFAEIGVQREIAPRTESAAYGRAENTIVALVGEPDYFDYYQREGLYAEVGGYARRLRTRLTLFALAEQHRAVRATTSYDLLGQAPQRLNPVVPEGDLRSVGAEVTLGEVDGGLGAALAGQRGLRLRVEAAGDALGSDFGFVRAEGVAALRVPTFLRRRLIPNTLDLRLAGGLHGGDLPPQRFFGIDGTLLAYAPTGTFRTLRGQPVEGDAFVAASWEHDFRSVPFELLGLEALAVRNVGLSIHGAHGRVWLDGPGPETRSTALRFNEGWVNELGVSLHGGFVLPVRLDLTYRFDSGTASGLGSGLFFSFGVARLF